MWPCLCSSLSAASPRDHQYFISARTSLILSCRICTSEGSGCSWTGALCCGVVRGGVMEVDLPGELTSFSTLSKQANILCMPELIFTTAEIRRSSLRSKAVRRGMEYEEASREWVNIAPLSPLWCLSFSRRHWISVSVDLGCFGYDGYFFEVMVAGSQAWGLLGRCVGIGVV
jgi:hypothetical protein